MMTPRTTAHFLIQCSILFLCVSTSVAQNALKYPPTRSEPFDTVIYDQKIADEFAWLSQAENEKEMLEWAKNQGSFTNEVLDKISGTEKITDLLEKIYTPNENEIIVKGSQGSDVFYYKSMADGKRWLIKKTFNQEKEEQMMELPIVINGSRYSAKKFAFAHKQKLLALMLVQSGESNPHIRFFDLQTRKFLNDSIGPVMFNDASGVSMAWLPNDAGLIYTQAPSTNSEEEKYYRGKLKLHLIGGKQEKDQALFGFEVNPNIEIKSYETPYVYSFPNSPYIIARIRAGKGENFAFAIHHSNLKGGSTPWIKLKSYRCNHGTFTVNNDYLYAVDDAVPNLQVIKVNLKTGAPPSVLLKESDKILAMSTGDPSIVSGKNGIFIKYTAPGKQGILKMNYLDAEPKDVKLPFDGSVAEFNLLGENDLLFSITNWVKNYEYHIVNHLNNSVIPFSISENSGINTDAYATEIIYIKSRDGVEIPVSLVYKKTNKLKEKPMPLLIDSYGCFGSSMDPLFNPDYFVWLEMGGIYAAAHIRGGSELGSKWAEAGAYPTKMNSINDIVDIGAYFVANNYTTPAKQAITGASCGTLNVGLATLQRPDLFAAGLFLVGIPDLVTPKGSSFGRGQNDFGPLDTEDGFLSRYAISAYHHITPNKSAPAMLVVNGANDYIVQVHNAGRYVAKLQNVQKSDRPSLFMVDWNNGHNGAGTDPEDMIRIWKFLLWQTGHADFQIN